MRQPLPTGAQRLQFHQLLYPLDQVSSGTEDSESIESGDDESGLTRSIRFSSDVRLRASTPPPAPPSSSIVRNELSDEESERETSKSDSEEEGIGGSLHHDGNRGLRYHDKRVKEDAYEVDEENEESDGELADGGAFMMRGHQARGLTLSWGEEADEGDDNDFDKAETEEYEEDEDGSVLETSDGYDTAETEERDKMERPTSSIVGVLLGAPTHP